MGGVGGLKIIWVFLKPETKRPLNVVIGLIISYDAM